MRRYNSTILLLILSIWVAPMVQGGIGIALIHAQQQQQAEKISTASCITKVFTKEQWQAFKHLSDREVWLNNELYDIKSVHESAAGIEVELLADSKETDLQQSNEQLAKGVKPVTNTLPVFLLLGALPEGTNEFTKVNPQLLFELSPKAYLNGDEIHLALFVPPPAGIS